MKFIDQLDRNIEIHFPPKRIISLVPSQSELLSDLGLENEIVGITKFCVHPPHLKKTKANIGGTKKLHIEKIKSLKPDLIIANKEENLKQEILMLDQEFPVWISDVQNFNDAMNMILSIGEITARKLNAEKMIHKINAAFKQLKQIHQIRSTNKKITCVYLIWENPLMTIGGDTFIHHQIELAGFENVYKNKLRYPEIHLDEIKKINPDIIFLSTEPFPFKKHDIEKMQKIFISSKVLLVDGEMFSWYGSRMQQSFQYFTSLYQRIEHLA